MVVGHEPELKEEDFGLRARPVPSGAAAAACQTLEDVEKSHILRILEECQYNQTRAAEMLKIDRVTLHNRLKKYGWSRPLTEVR